MISPRSDAPRPSAMEVVWLLEFAATKYSKDRPFPSYRLSHTTANMPSTHNVDKPWDTDDIDKWKVCFAPLFSILS